MILKTISQCKSFVCKILYVWKKLILSWWKNVVFDFSEKEYEIAVWLSKTFNENVYINPRINYPEGIKTSD